jgi:hypothetical protein
MKLPLIAASIAAFQLALAGCCAQTPCHVEVRTNVELIGLALRLADVLTPDTCPGLLNSAAQIRVGSAPSEGSVRVLAGTDVSHWLQEILDRQNSRDATPVVVHAPERIVVRRAGRRASCADIEHRILSSQRSAILDEAEAAPIADPPQPESPGQLDCGTIGRISPHASFELGRKLWDPALRRWILFARCKNPRDCVPFIVTLRDPIAARDPSVLRPPSERQGFVPSLTASPSKSKRLNVDLVRRGQTVILLWVQDGIRITVPASCLEGGGLGETVRARIAPSGRVVRAIVLAGGMLKAVS